MLITWDDRKNKANFKKHKVWFEEAQTVIFNPLTLEAQNDHPDGDRMEYLGHSSKNKLLYVVTVEKEDEDVIRIISARQAEPEERRKYEEGI